MRKSKAHEHRQSYNAQAVVCAAGSQLILATNIATTSRDQPSFAATILAMEHTILAMEHTIGVPCTVLADAGFASGAAVAKREAKNVEPPVAIAQTQPHRPYDFRPPPKPKPERRIWEPWRLAMQAKRESEKGKSRYGKPKQTVNRSSAASLKAPSDLPVATSAAARKSPPSGSSSPSPITAAAYYDCVTKFRDPVMTRLLRD
jgi:hypothetical protein